MDADAARIREQIMRSLDALKLGFNTLPDESTTESAAMLLARRRALLGQASAIAQPIEHSGADELETRIEAQSGLRIRIHGDYHLGQVLRTHGDYVILDFEGEPARVLGQRRAKQSPLRDVAGMLRSFSYAAYSALDHFAQRHPGTQRSLESWSQLWQNAVSTEFLVGWRSAVSANAHLTPQPRQAQRLLNAYLLEKAMYELLYELNNRPGWVRIPLAGIVALPHQVS
jgi:maltose alpha-D-glucosyltransferase / alpha-amylase